MPSARRTIGPEEEKVIRRDERSRLLAELAGSKPRPLTLADVAKMRPEEVAERLDEVSALQSDPAAWKAYEASQQPSEEAA